jgi:hypothetical protein
MHADQERMNAMKKTKGSVETKRKTLRCLVCGRRIETQTIVKTRSGARRSLSAAPGELTQCDCRTWLEYGGSPGDLHVKCALPERVQAFRELERERPHHSEVPAILEYVRKHRTMPRRVTDGMSGAIRFTFVMRP